MIKKVFNFLDKDVSGLHKAAYILAFSAFLSQLLALLRDRVLAHTFGASESLDIYYAAFRIPDFIFITVASVVSVSVLIPILAKEKQKDRSKETMNEVFSVFFFLILLISGVFFFLMLKLNTFIFRGFSGEIIEQVTTLSRIMLLSPVLLGFSNLFTSVIQSQRKFFIYALSPILYNIGIILGVLYYYPLWGLKGLAWGVITGAFLHLIIQLPSIYRLGFIPSFVTKINFAKIKYILLLSLPRTLAVSASSLSILFLVSLATYFREGSIAIFTFAYALQSIPLSIIGVSYTTAVFPVLSAFNKEEKINFIKYFDLTTRYILFWTFLAATLLFFLRAQIVRTVLGSGEFSWLDTRLTAACLALFVISIPAQSLILFFVRSYYAIGLTKRPVFINIFSALLVAVFAFFFKFIFFVFPSLLNSLAKFLKVGDISYVQVLVLPLAFSCATLINLLLLYVFIKRDFAYEFKRKTSFVLQLAIAFLLTSLTLYFSLKIWDNIFDIKTLFGIFFQGLLAGLSGIFVWFIVLFFLKNKEVVLMINNIKNFFKLR